MQNISAQDFFKKTTYNSETLNQLWCTQIADAHDSICSCQHPFAHLLSSIFPPGHTDRDLTISQIINRDYNTACHSGGGEEEDLGMAAGTSAATLQRDTKEEPTEEENIEDLLAAADAAERR